MSDTLLIGITGFVATLVTTYFSNSHSIKIKAMEVKQVVYTFEKIVYADGRIDSAEVSIGLLQMNRLIPDIRKEVKQQTLKIDQQI